MTRTTYYGNAAPEGTVASVGGAELVVDGWAAYEAARRAGERSARSGDQAEATPQFRSDSEAETAEQLRGGSEASQRPVTPEEVLEDLVLARPAADDPLARAAERLADAMERGASVAAASSSWWENDNDFIAIGGVSAEDIRETPEIVDPASLIEIVEAVEELAPHIPPIRIPPLLQTTGFLKMKPVFPNDSAAIAQLENDVLPVAEAVEQLRGEMARFFDAAADAARAD